MKKSGEKEWVALSHKWVDEKFADLGKPLSLKPRAHRAFVAARNRQRDLVDNMLYEFLSAHNFNITQKQHTEIKTSIHNFLDKKIDQLELMDPTRWSHIED